MPPRDGAPRDPVRPRPGSAGVPPPEPARTGEEPVVLRDGTPARIRPVRPDDGDALRAALAQLSPESRYHRFLSPVRTLSDDAVRRFVDVDGVDHVALVLCAPAGSPAEEPVAIARVVRVPGSATDADVAVTVVDAWHGRGVASAVLDALMRRRPRGVTRLVTEVSVDNRASMAMLARLGSMHRTAGSEGVAEVTVDLLPPPGS